MSTDTPTRLRDLKIGVRDMPNIPPRAIHVEDGHNPRDYSLAENREHLSQLKESIREHGVKIPLQVRWCNEHKRPILVDGECRLRACLELLDEGVDIVSVPVIQVQAGNEADRLVTALVSNTGKPLSQMELGSAYRRLVGYGWPPDKIAKSMGIKLSFVNQALELSDAPIAVKDLVSSGKVTPALAVAQLRKNGAGAEKTLKEAVEKAGGKPVKREKKMASTIKISVELRDMIQAVLIAVTEGKECSDKAAATLQAMAGI